MIERENAQKLIKEQSKTTYRLAKEIGIDKSILYKYCDCISDIKNMPVALVLKLSYNLKIDPNELYERMLKYQDEKRRNKINSN